MTTETRKRIHFTEKSPIDTYIEAQDPTLRPLLNQIRKTISTHAPDAQERISWEMPTFWQGKNLIHFALFKTHIGLFPGAEAVKHFADRLKTHKTSKGGIQFPLSTPIDLALIADIVKWRVEQLTRQTNA